jgi:hypothetical protein
MYRTGCTSLHSIAVWLRLQLPPLHLANTDCVMEEMKIQLGVTGKKAANIIQELNVEGKCLCASSACWRCPSSAATISAIALEVKPPYILRSRG